MQIEPISIAIVDDHTLFREGLVSLMSEFDEINIVFDAENGVELQKSLNLKILPEVILMDINMPVMDGYLTTSWLKKCYPEIKVLALSMFDDDDVIIRMIKCGASGYVLKQSKPRNLLEAIQTIKSKGFFVNELVSGKLLRSVAYGDTKLILTAREIDFLKWVCSELTYKEIADRMFVSPRTVDNYRESLFHKLQLKSRTGLVLYAIDQGIFKIKEWGEGNSAE
jgi:DNA-binding NarL/FixJ family response regulator